MKKLLLVALLMLALVITAVACNGNETVETTAGETTAAQTPATAEPEDSTSAPETPTEAPEVPTEAPEVPTEAPEVPTEAPEVPTQAPVVTTEPETEAPVDPMAPINVFEAADIATMTGMNGVASADLVDNYLHVVPSTADPYWYPFASVDGGRYVAIRYRTDATGADIQFYLASSGNGPTDDSTMLRQPVIADSEWHLIIIDTQSLIDAGKYDGEFVSYFRFDPLEAGYILDENGEPQKPDGSNYLRYELPEGCSIDVEYVAFFHSPEAAEKYDADTHFVAPPHNDQTLVLGSGQGAPFSGAGDKKIGQRIDIGENFLKKVTVISMATYSDGNANSLSFKVWQWNTDYDTTVAGQPLFATSIENHVDCSSLAIEISADLGIRGDIYYEVEYLSGSGGVTGWTSDASSIAPGIETYSGGALKEGTFSASIIVGVPLPTHHEDYTVPQDQWVVSGHKPAIQDSSDGMVAAGGLESGALLHQGAIALGEIDLSKYDKVIVYVGMDNSPVTIERHAANANNRLMLVTADTNMNNSPAEETIIASVGYEPMGWAVVAYEIDLTGVDYNGPVYFTYDTLPGTFLLVGSVEFIA